MESLENILAAHYARYPQMQPQDAVKLLYQNEFGCGHLLKDPKKALAYLKAEYAQTPHDANSPLWEDIGNGLGRIYLAALPVGKMEALGRAFFHSAADRTGETEAFKAKLAVLAKVPHPYSDDALKTYLTEYAATGFPMVSHSEIYRANYHPAYRVVTRERAEEEGLL